MTSPRFFIGRCLSFASLFEGQFAPYTILGSQYFSLNDLNGSLHFLLASVVSDINAIAVPLNGHFSHVASPAFLLIMLM